MTLIHELKNSPTSDWHFLHWPMAERLSPSSSSAGGAGERSTSIAVGLVMMSEAIKEGSKGERENRNRKKVRRSGASVWLQVASAASLVIRPSRDRQLLGTGEASDGASGPGTKREIMD